MSSKAQLKASTKYRKSFKGKEAKKRDEKSEKGKLRSRRYILKKKYKISYEEYLKMLEDQKGVCQICNKKCISNQDLAVDHDHKTGKVRGLLCMTCNNGLGLFRDDIKLLEKAIKYLKNAQNKNRNSI